jgi:hypothetical protein
MAATKRTRALAMMRLLYRATRGNMMERLLGRALKA